MEDSTKPDAKRWLFGLMDVLSHDEFTWLTVTLWAIGLRGGKQFMKTSFRVPYLHSGLSIPT
jgi:hypothetical protein